MIHSNAPWVPSGYGQQCRLLMGMLRDLGHDVAVSAFHGLSGSPIEWDGFTILPAGQMGYGLDTIVPHAQSWGADLTITLMDFWQLAPIAEQLREINLAAWLPVDCTPLSRMDDETLKRSGARPIAMSVFGQDELQAAGHDPLYAPHVHDISEEEYRTLQEAREQNRQDMGITDRYVVGICAANNDMLRKGFPEQFEAFRRFHALHPEALLLVHSIGRTSRGVDLVDLAHRIGLQPGTVRLSDSYAQLSGAFDNTTLHGWYSVLDVLSQGSYAEAFGVPMIEAQACGTPVVATDGSAMVENIGYGWLAAAEPFWNFVHGAWWRRPNMRQLVNQYQRAYSDTDPVKRERAREFATQFHVTEGAIAANYWKPILEELAPKGAE
jgi:glycosyltransferase involved in cell wall biosynthesis